LIVNNGDGFSKEELKDATEQFYGWDKNRNSKNHYGIGLAVTKPFVALYHGDIELSNSTKMRGHR
jgi:two-component system, OmpR family, lantibiotic biosynthesis sensor histidine kinase NisK/SpaK